jgi:hypothetical protein
LLNFAIEDEEDKDLCIWNSVISLWGTHDSLSLRYEILLIFLLFVESLNFAIEDENEDLCILNSVISRQFVFNPFTASCKNAMSLSVPGVPEPCEKFPYSSQMNFE